MQPDSSSSRSSQKEVLQRTAGLQRELMEATTGRLKLTSHLGSNSGGFDVFWWGAIVLQARCLKSFDGTDLHKAREGK